MPRNLYILIVNIHLTALIGFYAGLAFFALMAGSMEPLNVLNNNSYSEGAKLFLLISIALSVSSAKYWTNLMIKYLDKNKTAPSMSIDEIRSLLKERTGSSDFIPKPIIMTFEAYEEKYENHNK
jgi:cytosine/uracil/thiamine/allantoin permease